MALSIFKDLIAEVFQGVTLGQYEKINGSPEAPNYYHDQYLNTEYSADMTYNSLSGDYTRISADIVSFDSPLPIKSRGAIKSASGEIPKIGMKMTLNEKEMNTLRILRLMPGRGVELARKVFADAEAGIYGVKERLEQAFLLGFSNSGVTLIQDTNNAGLAVRIDFNVPAENKFGVATVWSDPASTPISDLKAVRNAARAAGQNPNTMWMDSNILANLHANTQVKELFAFNQGFVGANVPTLDDEQVQGVIGRALGLNVIVIDRSFVEQKDKTKTVSQGWTPNMVVLTTGTDVGTLVYSTLAEEEFPQEHVQYAKANDYILVSKSGQDDPVSEKTMVQAIAFPILKNVESLFYIDTATVEA